MIRRESRISGSSSTRRISPLVAIRPPFQSAWSAELNASFDIVGVKQLVRSFTERLIQERIIELLDRRVLMGLSQHLNILVIMVEGLGPKRPLLVAGRQRLSPSPDTASRAAHDLNEVIVGCAVGHLVHQFSSIGQ